MRRRTFIPLRPKRPLEEQIPEPLRTPPVNHGMENVVESRASPSDNAPILVPEQSRNMNEADAPQFLGSFSSGNAPMQWPSQVAQSNTMWLLPPYHDQSSSLALLLRTELEAHKVTKEMLHSTERRRQEAVKHCERLQNDINGLSTSYNLACSTIQ
ncbi:hypothetical protein DM02DRAFT_665330 [Periconia macrospinosa]|uniref:Uncharacterized protein n=1 Tax=Periconia macrospinosa TaxID=97972 RepID=A0A2V1CYI1_9PLEO|nr:hypothetical protein DM02DRAFT_665330 [Periconia macrospinosa]